MRAPSSLLPIAIGAIAVSPVSVCRAQTSLGGFLQLTQDYVAKGLSQTCGDPAAQADLHVRRSGESGSATAFAGVWGSVGIGRSPCGSSREADLYAGGNWVITPSSNLTVTYVRYSFPGGSYYIPYLAGRRYDYDEFDALWTFRDRFGVSLGWTPDALTQGYRVPESDRHGLSYGLEVRQPIGFRLTLSASVGYDRILDPAGTGYGFWSVGLGRSFGRAQLDLAYFRASPRAARIFSPEVAGGRVAASASWRF
jgi:uncharacterized protein (TIGR02001 family)